MTERSKQKRKRKENQPADAERREEVPDAPDGAEQADTIDKEVETLIQVSKGSLNKKDKMKIAGTQLKRR